MEELTSIDMETFLSEEDTDAERIIEDLIARDTLTILSGVPKRAKKTFTATTLGMVAAAGNVYNKLKPARPHKVVLVAAEGKRRDIRNACAKIKAMIGSPDISNMHILYGQPLKLDGERDQKRLLAYVEREEPELVILDNWTYFKKGNENDVAAMMPVYECLQAIREKGIAVLLLCHLSKSAEKKWEGAWPDIDDEIRGSSILSGAYDIHLAIRQRGRKGDGELLLIRRGKAIGEDERDIQWYIDEETCSLNLSAPR